ncbi:NAD-dependent epimerase/dehydratase family protein [Pseudomonas cavernicola]|uniref:NAD-dependent epimerase/dehydratase family protein n=1 Tax=Pseudomonas cavernicola TaxID=2320866 RepID=A0A418XNY1_9PSED|nr:NAD(P)H-binding protein [Pseudomonas cavernicola]RJG14154.1 NAD-dependent epimerase/dehydratase family protein [Pseudomonas cavernicola]
MITVMGATGHTGKRITELLLQAGEQVRALGRSESKLAGLARAGAQVLAGDPTDAAFLTKAFRGADAVYTLLPYEVQTIDYHAAQKAQGEAIVKALHDSGTRHVVALSSVGADLPSGTGPIVSLHAQEARLRGLEGANVLILRAGALFENFYGALGFIKEQGINGDAVAADVAIPMIATRDIAEVAAKALRDRNWSGVVVRELLGPRDLTYAEATRILGARLGKPDLAYVQLSYTELVEALQQAGFSENLASLSAELAQAFNERRVKSREGRKPESTTPTRFEDFVEELASV